MAGQLRDELIQSAQEREAYWDSINKRGASKSCPKANRSLRLPAPYHRKIPGTLEKTILQEAIAHLTRLGAFFSRVEAGGVIQHTGPGQAVLRPSRMVGMPDLIACYDGQFLGIECKAPGGQLSSMQHAKLTELAKAGGIAMICVDPGRLVQAILNATLGLPPEIALDDIVVV